MYGMACSCRSDSLVCSACPESHDYENYRSRDYYRGLDLAGSRCILNKQFTTPVGLSGKPGINVRDCVWCAQCVEHHHHHSMTHVLLPAARILLASCSCLKEAGSLPLGHDTVC